MPIRTNEISVFRSGHGRATGLVTRQPKVKWHGARIAQLVEQRIENPRVGGSIPPLGTIKHKKPAFKLAFLFYSQYQLNAGIGYRLRYASRTGDAICDRDKQAKIPVQ